MSRHRRQQRKRARLYRARLAGFKSAVEYFRALCWPLGFMSPSARKFNALVAQVRKQARL